MSIDNPTTALDRALGAEERANERVCELEDELTVMRTIFQKVALVILPALTKAQRKKLIAELRPELEKVMSL